MSDQVDILIHGCQIKLTEHETAPPGYLTESELITLMEKHRIGTVRNWNRGMAV